MSLVDRDQTAVAKRLQKSLGLPVGLGVPGRFAATPGSRPAASEPRDRDRAPADDERRVTKPRSRLAHSNGDSHQEKRRGSGVDGAPTGTVKWFDARKGFGFIACEGRADLFVHFSSIEGGGYRSLDPGQVVTFDIGPGRHGDEAQQVRVA